jgi:hypothetical protein
MDLAVYSSSLTAQYWGKKSKKIPSSVSIHLAVYIIVHDTLAKQGKKIISYLSQMPRNLVNKKKTSPVAGLCDSPSLFDLTTSRHYCISHTCGNSAFYFFSSVGTSASGKSHLNVYEV